ncbi:hypothetical protein HDU67_006257 [Dinochytrium kinnereticum]|nr:hypothetical protein HDU67_006257 [Dinochytrium kinnereticum]
MQHERFVAKFIRKASRFAEKRRKILESLEAGLPFVEETTGALAMIDISGFSSLTSILAKKGKISSEVITQAVSSFMSRIIDVISSHNGDVIKFLGDALLVIFESDGKNWKDMQQALRRCLVCCVDVLLQCGSTKVDFTNFQHLTENDQDQKDSPIAEAELRASNSLKRRGSERLERAIPMGSTKGKGGIGSGSGLHLPLNQGSGGNVKKKENKSQFVLELHIAMSGGELNHCVIGVSGERCDYFVYGSCLDELGDALDLAKPGELSISQDGWGIMELNGKSGMGALRLRKNEAGHVTCDRGSLPDLKTIVSREIQKRENFKIQVRRQTLTMSQPHPGSVPMSTLSAVDEDGMQSVMGGMMGFNTFHDQPDRDEPGIWALETFEFTSLFMNQSLVHKLQQAMGATQNSRMGASDRRQSIANPGQAGDNDRMDEDGAIPNVEAAIAIEAGSNDASRFRGSTMNRQHRNSTFGTLMMGGGRKSLGVSADSAGQGPSKSGMSLDSAFANDSHSINGGEFTSRFVDNSKNRRVSLTSEISSGIAGGSNGEYGKGIEANRNILSEYRKVSVMFVKLAFQFDPDIAQKAFALAFNAMLPYDGVIQQYSVDDKGQSLLIVFGLPPWGHENNSLYALKASVSLSTNMRKEGVGPFTISIATGDLLFSILGNSLRSEAGLLGDVVNISARLMSLACISELSILCDHETRMATADVFNYLEFGRQIVKGKTEPIQVWAALSSKASPLATDTAKGPSKGEKLFCGYSNETAKFVDATIRWKEKGEQIIIIIEAPTGMGKSTFLEEMMKENEKIRFCTGQGNEIDRFTAFFCFQGVMRSLYTVFIREILPSYVETGPTHLQRPKTQRSASTASTGIAETILSSQWTGAGKRKKVHARDSISVDFDYGDYVDIYKFLSYFGENTDLAPLLHDVMPWIKIEENTVTSNLAGQARTTILHEMLVKIISLMAEKFNIAIAFDNAQATLALIKICPKLMVIFATRPLSQYKSKGLETVIRTHEPLILKLGGLTLKETEDFLIWKFRDWGVVCISTILTEAIQTRSSGSPLFIEQLADSIYFRSPPVVRCSSEGVLEPVSKSVNLDQILVRNVETAVLVSFDRLNPAFQELLRVASVFGQNFNLRHIVSVMETDMSVEEVAESIKEFDSFQFLKTGSEDAGNQSEKTYDYFFRHINFNNAIYDSLPFAQRQEVHFKIAAYFESILTDDNRASILPNLSFHYMRTSIRDKNYFFMEQLAVYYLQHKLFTEASVSLERLLKFYESDSQAAQDPTLTAVRQASWLSLLGYSLLSLEKRSHEARMVSLRALSLVGVHWPKKKDQYKRELKKNYHRLMINRLRTIGGLIRLGKKYRRDDKTRLEVIFRSLAVLRSIASLNPADAIEDIPLMTLLYLNFAFENSREYLLELVKACIRSSQLFWFAGRRRASMNFLNYAVSLLPQVESSINLDLMPVAHVLCYRGQFDLAKDFLKRCSKYAEISGDRPIFTMAEFTYIQIEVLQGFMREAVELGLRIIQVCDVANDIRSKGAASAMLLFIMGLMGSKESTNDLVKNILEFQTAADPLAVKEERGKP